MDQAAIAGILGWIATSLGVAMWLTLVHQIRLNIGRNKGSWVVASSIVLNCVAWVSYGLLAEPRVWPVVIANVPGIVLGAIALYTSFPLNRNEDELSKIL